MKKTINGKRYDTEKAELIAEFSRSNPSDFNYVSEKLYRTKIGNWFIAGEGGANSKYAKLSGNSSWGSSDITAITNSEALEWLQEHDENDAIDKYFAGEIEEA